jgi:prepilin-type N-terminal cleavage/methylation domain-containing protein
MKLYLSSRRSVRAFSLAEMLVVVAIFSLLIAATVASQMFGLRMYRISETKLTTTASARRALNFIRDEIRSGKVLYVGTGDNSPKSFVATPDSTPHIGNALKICPTSDTNNFIYYNMDKDSGYLRRFVSRNGASQIVARYITNQMVFQAEDFQGIVVTNDKLNRVIRLDLQFSRKEYAVPGVKNGVLYDYYELQTRVAKRAID